MALYARAAQWTASAALSALALVAMSSPAAASVPAVAEPAVAAGATGDEETVEAGRPQFDQLAQRRDGNASKPPVRGSSAELYGGSSADRYGGSSADRRGVAGRYDPRNRGVRQYDARHRKREEPRKKPDDELDDQEEEPAPDRYSGFQPSPLERGRGDRD